MLIVNEIFKECTSRTKEINAKARGRNDAEKFIFASWRLRVLALIFE